MGQESPTWPKRRIFDLTEMTLAAQISAAHFGTVAED
jgi:hypothetical protein